jgi:hypothetical protein
VVAHGGALEVVHSSRLQGRAVAERTSVPTSQDRLAVLFSSITDRKRAERVLQRLAT